MKKLLAIVMVAAMTLSMGVMANAADAAYTSDVQVAAYTSDVQVADGTVTVTVSATATQLTDVGIIYDPAVYTCKSIVATDEFEAKKAEKNEDGEKCYMGDYVVNKAAKTGDVTYAVFTSAIEKASAAMPDWNYSGAFAVFKFALVEGKTSADAAPLVIVTDTAAKKDAAALAADPAKTVTAEEIKGGLDATPEPQNPSDETTPEPQNPSDETTPEPQNPSDATQAPQQNPSDATQAPAGNGSSNAAKTADVAPVAAMVTLVLMAGAVLVVLKKRAAE